MTYASVEVISPPACKHRRVLPCTCKGSPETPLIDPVLVIRVQSSPAAFATSSRIAEHWAPVSKVATTVLLVPLICTGYMRGHILLCVVYRVLPSPALHSLYCLHLLPLSEVPSEGKEHDTLSTCAFLRTSNTLPSFYADT